MRTASICPTCSTVENALCVLYNGDYLNNLQINPLDNLEVILGKINTNFIPIEDITTPLVSATYKGQLYLNNDTNDLYAAVGVGLGAADWDLVLKVPSAGVPEYLDNTDALLSGLTAGKLYRTGDILKIVY